MLPKWLKRPCDQCELLAYDDGQGQAFFRMNGEVYCVAYAYLNLCDDEAWSQLTQVVQRFGKQVSSLASDSPHTHEAREAPTVDAHHY